MATLTSLLAPGIKAPSYGLVRPKSQPTALWGGRAGSTLGAQGWKGVGGGWWTPPKNYKPAAAPSVGTQPAAQANSATTQTTQPSPLDSTYFGNVNQNQLSTQNKIAGINAQSGYARTGLQNSLANLARQHPVDILAARVAANRRGALDSSVLGTQLGGIDTNYNARVAGVQNTFATQQAARDAQIQALQDAQQQYQSEQYGAAADRASQAAAADQTLGVAPAQANLGAAARKLATQILTPVNRQYFAPGAKAPSYALVRPKGAPASARWSSTKPTSGKWRGIGGGWWVPA